MYNKQAYQSEFKGNCGPMGRGKFGGPWGRGKFGGFWSRHAGSFGQPPVNIEETDSEYIISLFAAGLRKEQVTLTVKDDVLRIGYSGDTTDGSTKYTYQEYNQSEFERSFQLNGKVLTDGVSASYADGILRVTLPKNPETNAPAQTINVA
jgi:HSP20 family protein